MRKKFQTAGLGGARGVRTEAMAQRLYESLPKGVRNLGEEAVKEFMNGKHASHIKSVANAPGRAKWPSNVLWEKAGKNIARGSRNMKASEISGAKSAARGSAINVGLKSTLRSIARGGAIASAIEAPIAGLENILHWRRGRKTSGKAARDSIKSAAVAGGIGGAMTGGLVVARAVGLTGVPLGLAGIPLMVASAGLFAVTTIRRITRAAKHDLPLDKCTTYFCKEGGCKTKFAQALTDVANEESSQQC